MSPNLVALLYLVAGVLFILALRGLSSPESSRRGNLFGMIGMAIAVLTTLGSHPPAEGLSWGLVIGGIAVGGSVGAVIARRVPMTSMPELVAAFHSLVGMAAVLVAAGAFYAPSAFDIGTHGNIHHQSLIEMSLGVAIGAITFSGSLIAFAKLDGRMSGKPILLPARHLINIALAIALVVLVVDSEWDPFLYPLALISAVMVVGLVGAINGMLLRALRSGRQVRSWSQAAAPLLGASSTFLTTT